MRYLRSALMNLHKILGLLLGLLFLMWFLSGIVMIYHSFPRASKDKLIIRLQDISGPLPDMRQLAALCTDSAEIKPISMDMHLDRPVIRLKINGEHETWYADSLLPLEPFSDKTIEKTVALWCQSPILRIDSLYEPDQWIPFERQKEDYPIYKYTFAGEDEQQLYITSKEGKVLQFTNKEERFWAWIGAIPHWVYFTALRQNQSVWVNFVKWTSGIGTLMCLAGLLLAVWIGRKNRLNRLGSPFKRRWHHWHYVSGLLFGVFAATFALSGMMSLTDMPDWLKKAPKEKHHRKASHIEQLPLSAYALDYRWVLETIDGVKQIEWANWKQHPYYRVTTYKETLNFDASDSTAIRPFTLSEEMIRQEIQKTYGDSISWTLELMSEYDSDYFSRKKEEKPLPVYRIIVDDAMRTHHYYNPQTLAQKQIDDDGRMRHLLYQGLHKLEFKCLTDHPILWNIAMYALMLGGTFLSLTGVVLTFKWLSRKIRKIIRKLYN